MGEIKKPYRRDVTAAINTMGLSEGESKQAKKKKRKLYNIYIYFFCFYRAKCFIFLLSLLRSKSAASWGFDSNAVSLLYIAGVLSPHVIMQRGSVAVLLDENVEPLAAVLAALEPEGGKHPPLGQDSDGERLQELHLADDAVSAAKSSAAAGMIPDAELVQQHWVPPLEDFRIRDARVRHVRVHRALTVPSRPGPGPARDRLVVPELAVAHREVVHAIADKLQELGGVGFFSVMAAEEVSGVHGDAVDLALPMDFGRNELCPDSDLR